MTQQQAGPAGPAADTFDSRDVGEVEAYVSKIYSTMHIGAVGEHTRARITRQQLSAEITFDNLDYDFDIAYAAEPPDRLIICDVVANTIQTSNAGVEDTFGPGDQFLISRPGLPYGGVGHASRLRFTLLDPKILSRVAATADCGPDDPVGPLDRRNPVRLLDYRPVSAQAQQHLQRAITYIRESVVSGIDGPAAPLIISTATDYLAASVLQTYRNTAVTEPTVADRRDATPNTVRRAAAYIDAHADLELSVSDIAHAAYVTPRALQLAFRRHLDTTPMAYLRRVRLERAREELSLSTRGDGRTVSAVAARWGFTSSRFTHHYKTTFGELPSQTRSR